MRQERKTGEKSARSLIQYLSTIHCQPTQNAQYHTQDSSDPELFYFCIIIITAHVLLAVTVEHILHSIYCYSILFCRRLVPSGMKPGITMNGIKNKIGKQPSTVGCMGWALSNLTADDSRPPVCFSPSLLNCLPHFFPVPFIVSAAVKCCTVLLTIWCSLALGPLHEILFKFIGNNWYISFLLPALHTMYCG